ncbi:ATP synthase subunit e, mitochondrial isoform X3 [Marmota marmota marmota]|uniref:ATP synthase subunit e, mitochondrial isoform X3 n=1 Tax=Marmota marmota marmota TaxID=9994 RepID=UPI002093F934|nr:ATP synthase subunit e, mitochondrial isoform X3 [Marmota marmota marmota]
MGLEVFIAFIHFRFSYVVFGNRNSRKSKERWTSPIPREGGGMDLDGTQPLAFKTTCPVRQGGGSTGRREVTAGVRTADGVVDHQATDGPILGNRSQGWLRCGGQVAILRYRSEQRDWRGGLGRGAPGSSQLRVLKAGLGTWGGGLALGGLLMKVPVPPAMGVRRAGELRVNSLEITDELQPSPPRIPHACALGLRPLGHALYTAGSCLTERGVRLVLLQVQTRAGGARTLGPYTQGRVAWFPRSQGRDTVCVPYPSLPVARKLSLCTSASRDVTRRGGRSASSYRQGAPLALRRMRPARLAPQGLPGPRGIHLRLGCASGAKVRDKMVPPVHVSPLIKVNPASWQQHARPLLRPGPRCGLRSQALHPR